MSKVSALLASIIVTAPLLAAIATEPANAVAPPLGALQLTVRLDAGKAFDFEGPQVAVSESGIAMAAWIQNDTTFSHVWASRYAYGLGWSTPSVISIDMPDRPTNVQIVSASNGTFLASWIHVSTNRTLWYARYDALSAWSLPAPINTTPGQSVESVLLAAGGGGVFATIQETSGSNHDLSALQYAPGAGWGSLQSIESLPDSAYISGISADEGGNATAAWFQQNMSSSTVFVNHFTPGGGWELPVNLGPNAGFFQIVPSVAMGPSGAALATWMAYDTGTYRIWSSRYAPGAGWSAAAPIENTSTTTSWLPKVTFDRDGDAVAVWTRENSSISQVFGAAYAKGSWGPPMQLSETGPSASTFEARLAGNADGHSFAAWSQTDNSTTSVAGSRYVKGQGWSAPVLLEADPIASASRPAVGLDAAGDALVAWNSTQPGIFGAWVWEPVPPVLQVSSPLEGATLATASVWVNGTTERGAEVWANGGRAQVSVTGEFSAMVPLQPGNNTLTVTAEDARGNENLTVIHVVFADPVPGLEADLAAGQAALEALRTNLVSADAQLASLQSALAVTEANLSAARADLAQAQADLAELASRANATEADLNDARANLSAAEARVSGLETANSATLSSIGALEANLSATAQALNETSAQTVDLRARLNASQSDLNASQASQQSEVDAAVARADTASLFALLAIVLSSAGIAVGYMVARKVRPGGDATSGGSR